MINLYENLLQLITEIRLLSHFMSKSSAPKQRAKKQRSPHLILSLAKEPQTEAQQPFLQCKYGLYCAHLRATGACTMPHKKSHFLVLNLSPAQNCIQDDTEEVEAKLSKKEKKQKKILEKTIKQNIDVETLTKQFELNKHKAEFQTKKELLESLDQKQRFIIDLVGSKSAEEYFAKLKTARESYDLFEMKKKSMTQIRKKQPVLYADIIDKEYRIANRLIKQAQKNSTSSLQQIYSDINHNTVESIRQYFFTYFDPQQGIPYAEVEPNIKKKKVYLKKLYLNIFHRDTTEFQAQYYLLIDSPRLKQLISNMEFYNLLVPYLHSKKQKFNKYFLIDCEQSLSLTGLSNFLTKDYALTFHTKCKPSPEYPFGQLESNLTKFSSWSSKISKKYYESEEANLVFIVTNIRCILPNPNANEFEQEKLKERVAAFHRLLSIFTPIVYILDQGELSSEMQALENLLKVKQSPKGKYENKIILLECN